MCKISSYNFLYVLCYNTLKNKTVFFGYTLAGLKFAKSDYGFYDNISFTGNGNIVTMNNKEEICVLSGSDLSKLSLEEDKEIKETKDKLNKIKGSNWMQFDFFFRKFDDDSSKILTFLSESKSKNKENVSKIQTLNVKEIKYFD